MIYQIMVLVYKTFYAATTRILVLGRVLSPLNTVEMSYTIR